LTLPSPIPLTASAVNTNSLFDNIAGISSSFSFTPTGGMGDGNVNVGAQRMYDMMKKLENGGRV
jgi:hypothetical protein